MMVALHITLALVLGLSILYGLQACDLFSTLGGDDFTILEGHITP